MIHFFIIFIVIVCISYFLVNLIVEKVPVIMKGKMLKWLVRITGTILFSCLLCMLAFWSFLTIFVREPSQIPFKEQEWKSAKYQEWTRYRMYNDLTEKYKLIGMTREEINTLLGIPDRDYQGKCFWYEMGPDSAFIGIDSRWLAIYFENDRIVKYDIKYD